MAPKKAPAFQFYPRDFLTDEKVVLMSNTEVGIYIRLLCYCWLETTLPLETEALAQFARMPLKQFSKLWEHSVVRTCFRLEEDGRLHHKRLDAEREKQAGFGRQQSDNAKARWQKSGNATAVPDTVPVASLSHSPRVADSRMQISSPEKDREDFDPRPARLIERYRLEWYPKYRHGAKLRIIGSPLEFQDAVSLCETWDDERLEKLAQIVLTTNEEFIASTDRSFKIFAIRASWADDRLRQEGA